MAGAVGGTSEGFQYDDASSGDEEVRYYHADDDALSQLLRQMRRAPAPAPAPARPEGVAGCRLGPFVVPEGASREEDEDDMMAALVQEFEAAAASAPAIRSVAPPLASQEADVMALVQFFAAPTEAPAEPLPNTQLTAVDPSQPPPIAEGEDAGSGDEFSLFFPEWTGARKASGEPHSMLPQHSVEVFKAVSDAKRRCSGRQQPLRQGAARKRPARSQREGPAYPDAEDIADFSDDDRGAKVLRGGRPSWEAAFAGLEPTAPPSAAIRRWQAAVAAASPEDNAPGHARMPTEREVCRNLFLAEDEPAAGPPAPAQTTAVVRDTARPAANGRSQWNLMEELLDGGRGAAPAGPGPPRSGGPGMRPARWQAQGPMADDVEDADALLPPRRQEAAAPAPLPGGRGWGGDGAQFNFGAMLDASPDRGPVFYPDHHQQLGLARWIGFSPVRNRKGFLSGLLQVTMGQLQVQYNDWSKASSRAPALPGPSQAIPAVPVLVLRIIDLQYEYSIALADALRLFEGHAGDPALTQLRSASSQQVGGPPCRLCLMRQQAQELALGAGSVVEVHASWRQVTVQGVPVITAAFFCRLPDASPPVPSQPSGPSPGWDEPPEVEG
eukprot:EG_transcript_5937